MGHQNSNSGKKHPRKWLQRSGGVRADQRRRVRLESAVEWEQRVLIILAYNFASLISFFHNELKILRRHPAEQLHGSDNCSLLMKYLYSML